MRPVILSLIVTTAALPALAKAPAGPSKAVLALATRAAHAAQPQLDQGISAMVEGVAGSYRSGAPSLGVVVNEKALAETAEDEAEALRPALWDSLARIYAEIYSPDELQILIDHYRDYPGDSKNLPTSLLAKADDLQSRQQALIGDIGARVLLDFFGEYCARAPCSDVTRQAAGLPVHPARP
jgi:hypothetical protein